MEDTWLLDSGCTHHVCKHRNWFQTFKEIHPEPINTAVDNSEEKPKGLGLFK